VEDIAFIRTSGPSRDPERVEEVRVGLGGIKRHSVRRSTISKPRSWTRGHLYRSTIQDVCDADVRIAPVNTISFAAVERTR
jgi:hypothetical protein